MLRAIEIAMLAAKHGTLERERESHVVPVFAWPSDTTMKKDKIVFKRVRRA